MNLFIGVSKGGSYKRSKLIKEVIRIFGSLYNLAGLITELSCGQARHTSDKTLKT